MQFELCLTAAQNYKSISGQDINKLWGLEDALNAPPQWHAYYVDPSVIPEEEDDVLNLGHKMKKTLQLTAGGEESDDSMPELQSVSNSSDEESDSDDITMASRPSSPYLDSAVPGILVSRRPSALVDTSSIPQEARRPTIEQNMAFAELRNTHHAADPERR